MTAIMTTEEYLLNFTSIVKWDVEKLILVAEQGEAVQLNQLRNSNSMATPTQSMSTPVPTPANLTANQIGIGIPSTATPATQSVSLPEPTPTSSAGLTSTQSGTGTVSINAPVNLVSAPSGSAAKLVGSPFHEQHTSEAAKCAIPMAMTLISAAEFIGSILEEPAIWAMQGGKFDKAIKKFFNYAGFPINQVEINVLRQSFRNGMAHNFMMQGEDVAIDYQTRFKTKGLLFPEGNQVFLNVIKLQEIVFDVLKKLLTDVSIHPTVAASVKEYENGAKAVVTAGFLRDLRAYWATQL
jgi:hypothetical protein